MANRASQAAMPHRATTINSKSTPSPRHHGFTLIELMVVLVIVGIVLTIAVLYLGGFGLSERAKTTANQLQQVMTVASQQAVLQPATIGMKITAKGYRFYQSVAADEFGQSKWVPLRNDRLSRPDAFDPRLKIHVKTKTFDQDVEDAKLPEIVFFPSGLATPAQVSISVKKKSMTPYVVQLLNSGEVSVGPKKS